MHCASTDLTGKGGGVAGNRGGWALKEVDWALQEADWAGKELNCCAWRLLGGSAGAGN